MKSFLTLSLVALVLAVASIPKTSAQAPTEPAQTPAAPPGRGQRPAAPPPVPPPAVMPAPAKPYVSMTPPKPDPRVGLKAGRWDAEQAGWNMAMVSTTPPAGRSLGVTHSDLAFTGKYVIQGNYNGFEIFDISNPAKPVLVNAYICPASQNDVSVFKHLVFMSSESTNSRTDCGFGGVQDPVSKDRVRGIRIFDISNIAAPKLVTSVQTCRGSHTHTVVTDPQDKNNIYIYVSGSSQVRSADELPGCSTGELKDNPDTAWFRLEVIKVPLADPAKAAIVSSPRIFHNLAPPLRNAERDAVSGRGRGTGTTGTTGTPAAGAAGAAAGGGANPGRGRGPQPSGTNQCHDITVYPDIGLGGGACAGYGFLLDIREAAYPLRIDAVADPNMSFWHSATFSNDGKKVLFSDEWGGGTQPRCRATDKLEWGSNAIFTIEKNKMVFKSHYKLPAAQTTEENCVAHNGSLIPIPGREVMVQAWYQGGVSVFDWTDPMHATEIAYFDRGPMDSTRLIDAGTWSAYWYNGVIVSSEIARGLDIYELLPSGLITQNEIDAAKTVKADYWNTQQQQKFTWPPSFAMARAYLDQLERGNGLDAAMIASARGRLVLAENAKGAARKAALDRLAAQLTTARSKAADQAKVSALVGAVKDLALLR